MTNWTTATDEEIVIAVAQLKGVTVIPGHSCWSIDGLGCYPSEHAAWNAVAEEERQILTSRDAIIPVIAKAIGFEDEDDSGLMANFQEALRAELQLGRLDFDDVYFLQRFLCATPSQLCIALLQAINPEQQ